MYQGIEIVFVLKLQITLKLQLALKPWFIRDLCWNYVCKNHDM